MNFTPLKIIPDVSMYQDDNLTQQKIDFVKMRQLSEGVIIRAGQNSWTDPDFIDNWQAAKEAGLKRGAYWFEDSRVDPLTQARHFYDLIKNDPPEWGMWCDFEESYGGTYRGEVNYKKFIAEVEHLFIGIVGVYTANWWWAGAGMVDNVFWQRFPLWVAQYASSPAYVTLPKPWVNIGAVLWQYTSKGDGLLYGAESLNIDLNYTSEEFYAMFGGTQPPNGGDVTEKWMVTVSSLSMRTEPIVDPSTFIQSIPLGSFFWGVYDVSKGWVKATHYQPTGAEFATAKDFYISGSSLYVAKQVYTDPPLAPPPPPVVGKITEIILDLAPGSTMTIKREDGTQEVETA